MRIFPHLILPEGRIRQNRSTCKVNESMKYMNSKPSKYLRRQRTMSGNSQNARCFNNS